MPQLSTQSQRSDVQKNAPSYAGPPNLTVQVGGSRVSLLTAHTPCPFLVVSVQYDYFC